MLKIKTWPLEKCLRFLRQTFFQQQFGRFRTLGTNCTVHTSTTWRRKVSLDVGKSRMCWSQAGEPPPSYRKYTAILDHRKVKICSKSSFFWNIGQFESSKPPTGWGNVTTLAHLHLPPLRPTFEASTLSTCPPSCLASRILVGPRPLEDLSRSQPWHTTPISLVNSFFCTTDFNSFHENLWLIPLH